MNRVLTIQFSPLDAAMRRMLTRIMGARLTSMAKEVSSARARIFNLSGTQIGAGHCRSKDFRKIHSADQSTSAASEPRSNKLLATFWIATVSCRSFLWSPSWSGAIFQPTSVQEFRRGCDKPNPLVSRSKCK